MGAYMSASSSCSQEKNPSTRLIQKFDLALEIAEQRITQHKYIEEI